MVDEAQQEENFEPTPYQGAYKKDLDKPVPEPEKISEEVKTETVDESKKTSFLEEKLVQEHDFKKRYDDLKSHYDKKLNEWKDKEKTLEEKINTSSQYTPPKSEEELEEFKERYPDVYEVVESIAHMQSNAKVKDVEEKIKELKDKEKVLNKTNAFKQLTTFHPDFDTLKDNTNFRKWLNEQPENISDGIYKNNTDAKWAARIVDLYKADHNLQNKQKTRPNAAEAVTKTKRGSIATDDGKRIWSVSEIAKLKPQQFVQYEKEIDQARREGRIEQT
jgi:hypothetical protein